MKPENCPVIVCFAIDYEAAPFQKALRDRPFIDKTIRVLITGVGAQETSDALADAVVPGKTQFVVGTGFCGSLIDELSVGQLVLDSKRSDKPAIEFAKESLEGAARPTVFTSNSEIVSGADRKVLRKSSKAEVVEMEGDVTVDFCKRAKVPYLGLRIVTDTPLHELPAPPGVIQRAAENPLAMASWLALHPFAAGKVSGFARTSDRCRHLLSSALLKLAFLWSATRT